MKTLIKILCLSVLWISCEEDSTIYSIYEKAENGDLFNFDNDGDGRKEPIFVEGYYKDDGTYVRSHYRAKPSSSSEINNDDLVTFIIIMIICSIIFINIRNKQSEKYQKKIIKENAKNWLPGPFFKCPECGSTDDDYCMLEEDDYDEIFYYCYCDNYDAEKYMYIARLKKTKTKQYYDWKKVNRQKWFKKYLKYRYDET